MLKQRERTQRKLSKPLKEVSGASSLLQQVKSFPWKHGDLNMIPETYDGRKKNPFSI